MLLRYNRLTATRAQLKSMVLSYTLILWYFISIDMYKTETDA